ncbi:MAG: SRPBCC family protein [Parachlamydiaceae bacterium]|nr:SRPBCC family protein [Parachlamydiaceae bacterium]
MLTLKYLQKLPLSLEDSWNFFSSPANLKILTPEHLDFEITNDHENRKMYAGQIIAYRIRPVLNLPLEWVSEITQVQEPYYFIDEQRFGPYKFWHHEHRFNPIPNGVEVVDIVYYKMLFGFLGKVLHTLKVKQDLEAIFSYRRAKLEELFGPYFE